jgi:hypothetical protein
VVVDFGVGFIAGKIMPGPFAGNEIMLPWPKFTINLTTAQVFCSSIINSLLPPLMQFPPIKAKDKLFLGLGYIWKRMIFPMVNCML